MRKAKYFVVTDVNYGSVHHVQMLLMQATSFYQAKRQRMCCKSCKLPAKNTVLEDKSIEDMCKEYTKELNLKMKSLEATIQKKVDVAELQKLQKKVEENENKIKELMENKSVAGRTWTDIMETPEKRTVEDVIEKSLKERDNEEKE